MKLIRLTDDRYVFDAGNVYRDQLEAIQQYFNEWWERHDEHPSVISFGGSSTPLEYEDRREPDIESRLRAIEDRIQYLFDHR